MISQNVPFSLAGFETLALSLQERAELLEKSRLGKGIALEELQLLADFMTVYQGAEASIVCRQGEASGFLCIVCRGRIDIAREDHEHKNKIIATIGPGNLLGEMSMIDGEPRSATAVAQTPVELLVLTKEEYERLSEQHPRLWGMMLVRIAGIISRRLRQTSGILAEYLEC